MKTVNHLMAGHKMKKRYLSSLHTSHCAFDGLTDFGFTQCYDEQMQMFKAIWDQWFSSLSHTCIDANIHYALCLLLYGLRPLVHTLYFYHIAGGLRFCYKIKRTRRSNLSLSTTKIYTRHRAYRMRNIGTMTLENTQNPASHKEHWHGGPRE